MPRIFRLVVKEEDAIYHVISRTALSGFVFGDVEKNYLLNLIKRLSAVFFVDLFGFCIMDYHIQTGNKASFMSTDFGLNGYEDMT